MCRHLVQPVQIILGYGGPDLCTSMQYPESDSCLNTPWGLIPQAVHPEAVYSQQTSATREENHSRVTVHLFRTVLWSLATLLWVFSTTELACIYSKQMEVQSSLGNVHKSWNWPKRLWVCCIVCRTNWMLSTVISLSIPQTFLVVSGLYVHREVKTNAITEAYLTFSGSSLTAEFKDTGKVCLVAAPGITQRASKSSQRAGMFPQCKCSLPFSTTFTTLDRLM